MPFFSERQRLAELEAAEAAGESLWTDQLSPEVRAKFLHAWRDATRQYRGGRWEDYAETYERKVRSTIERDMGLPAAPSIERGVTQGQRDLALSFVEAMAQTIGLDTEKGSEFHARVEQVLQQHRVSFKFLRGEFFPFESDELHANVIDPALRLLHGREDFAAAEAAYTKALHEISTGDAGDAITDAAVALAEAFTALGCVGRNLGAQISQAKSSGLLGTHDERLAEAMESVAVWIAAERNRGEAHKVVDPPISDAWLMVHVVGALILRLADSTPRQKLTTRE